MPVPKLTENKWSKDFEKEIYEDWKKNNIFEFNKKLEKKVYSIDTPPPYVNTPIHIGQATTYVLMDMFARFRRMIGYNVLFPVGLDRNGLPIELEAEKKFNVKASRLSREKFIELCKKLLEESSMETLDSFLRLGISFNSWKVGISLGQVYLTDGDDYRTLTQETFIDMWNNGLIYEDERVNNWCPGCQTTIADAEIDYLEESSTFYEIKFKIKETQDDVVIATTRPELIGSCGMVIYNPEDLRYKHLKALNVLTPLYSKQVPLRAHPIAQVEKGTGLLMMCSFGDVSDIRFFREMNLKHIILINQDGTMNLNSGFLEGLTVKEARRRIVEELNKKGLIVNEKSIVHRTPVCERSGDPIEFISMKEYYVKQLEFKNEMLKIAKKINFYADESRQILVDWINSVTIDWPISRRRYYATEIPLWYCESCKEVLVPKKGRYYKPWKDRPPVNKCKCGSTVFRGEGRVLDTWFDSSISPLYILKYSRDNEFFKKNFPCILRPQGKEIIRTWLYYTLLKDYLLTKKVAFKDVWINYHIVDENGKKMSKSLGNGIDPKEVLEKFGAEPFRLWTAVEGNLAKTDFRCSFDRIEGAGKTLTKLWNVARFISIFPKAKKVKKFNKLDEWIIQELNVLINEARYKYDKYDFHNPVIKIKHFIWETFASHYIEIVKNRAYNENNLFTKEEQNSALYTLHYCLDTLLKLLNPVVPFITYKIYYALNKEDLHFTDFPKSKKELKLMFSTSELVELNSSIWKSKKDKNMSLKSEIKLLIIPTKFRGIAKDLKEAHRAKEIKYGRLKIEF